MQDDRRQDEQIGKLWGALRELRTKSESSLQNITEHLFGVTGSNGIAGRLKNVEDKVEVIVKELPETLNAISERWYNRAKEYADQFNDYRYNEAPNKFVTKAEFGNQINMCNKAKEEHKEKKKRTTDVNIQVILLIINLVVMVTGVVSIFILF